MVKGVNKTVIEVNNTGNKMFEKIVFYVTPQYGNADPKRLQRAASEFSFRFDEKTINIPVRQRVLKQRRRKIALTLGVLLAVSALLIIALFVN